METLLKNLLCIAPSSYIPREKKLLNAQYLSTIASEHQHAFHPEPSRLKHHSPQIRMMQIKTIPTAGERILVLCNPKENYSGTCKDLGSKNLTIASVRSLLGPIFIESSKSKNRIINTSLDNIFYLTKKIDHLWIPDPYLASLFFRSIDLTSIAATRIKKSILFSINLEDTPDALHWTDDKIRTQLHTNGFIEVCNVDQNTQDTHITRYHEFKKYYSVAPPGNLPTGPQLYIAKKQPEVSIQNDK